MSVHYLLDTSNPFPCCHTSMTESQALSCLDDSVVLSSDRDKVVSEQLFLGNFRPWEREYNSSVVISASNLSIQHFHSQNTSSLSTYLPPTFAPMTTSPLPISNHTWPEPNYFMLPGNQPTTSPYIFNSSHQVVHTSVTETSENHLVSSSMSLQQLISASQIAKIQTTQIQTTTKPTIPKSTHFKIPIKSTNSSCEAKVFDEIPQSGIATSKVHDSPWSTHSCDQLSGVPTIQDYSVPFSGSAPYEFIQGYEEFFKVNPMTEIDMIQYVMQDFEGEALEWYYEYVEENFVDTWTPDCWEDFIIELYRKFAGEHQLFVERSETEMVKVSESKFVGNEPSEVVHNLFARMHEPVKITEQQIIREKFVEDEGVLSKINWEFNFLQTMVEYVNLYQVLRCDFDLWNYRLSKGLNFGFDPGDLSKWVKFLWSNPHILFKNFQYGFNNSKCNVRSCGIKFLDYYSLCGFNTTETDVTIGIGQSLQVQGHVNEYGLGYWSIEIYSLKGHKQNSKTVLKLMRKAFFKHGEKDALRSCVKAINFCFAQSQGELKYFAQNKLKELEDELIAKLKSAIKEVSDGDDEYSLLVNLKRLYELQLSKSVPIESVYEDIVNILQNFRNMDDEVVSFLLLNMYLHVAWCLHSIINNETVPEASISSLLDKRKTLFVQLEHFLQPSSGVHEEGNCGNLLACRVCTILAESWCLFRKTNFNSTKLESLGYCPNVSVLQRLWGLCEKHLNISDETEDEDANKEYVEETNRDAVMIAAAKLVAIDAVPKEYLGPEIISHFVMHGTSVAEIVRHMIVVLKKKDDDVSYIFLEALKRAYRRHLVVLSNSDYEEDLSVKSFQECKDLAARLSGTFVGAARSKHRADILKIVKDGIEFAFLDSPKQLSFLDGVVLHFVSKLPTLDILDILKDVQKQTENVDTDEDPSGWRPYYRFVGGLNEKYVKNEGVQDEKPATSVKRRGRPRKKGNIHGKKLFDEHSSSEEEDSISTSDHDAQDQQVEEEEEAPLIDSIRASSKLKSLRVSREENKGQTRMGHSGQATENLAATRTSGVSS